ncbi:MAG: hypothetical protein KDK09_12240 [Rhodobacteraceae bacterium]|nr:hypothetical protein [Paracoccaceae bacterium]
MPHATSFLKPAAFLALGLLASACSRNGAELGEMRPELGDFRLCYNIVTTNDAVKGPLSREADLDVFADHLRDEIDRRFGRYEGDRLYHIAMHIDAYVLAVPGVPLVASPRSALITSVDVWDDRLGRALNEEHEQMTVLESAGASGIIGSGLTQSADEQMQQLSRNAALRIEDWMAEHPEWFDHPEDAADTETAAADETAPSPSGNAPAGARAANGDGAPSCGRR